jgi:hypothetical protein
VPVEGDATSSNKLGDWYASIIFSRPQQVLIFASERSLLPVLLPARELSTLIPRFRVAVRSILTKLALPHDVVEAELASMAEVVVAPTSSRVVLGSMNEFIFQFRVHDPYHNGLTLEQFALYLADMPCGQLKYGHPAEATRQLLCAA